MPHRFPLLRKLALAPSGMSPTMVTLLLDEGALDVCPCTVRPLDTRSLKTYLSHPRVSFAPRNKYHICAGQPCSEMVIPLAIAKSVDVNDRSARLHGATALHCAVANARFLRLLEAGADPTVRCDAATR